MAGSARAIRGAVRGTVQGVGFRAATVARARELGLLGWVRNEDDGSVAVHAEGAPEAVEQLVAFLHDGPPGAQVDDVQHAVVRPEGHEQFAIRGVPAGRFVVEALEGERASWVLRLEVEGEWRSWRLTKPPSMVPAERRFASELPPTPAAAGASGVPRPTTDLGSAPAGSDGGTYEQGGRVAWPEAITRGHAVFVLHGAELQGGFALQRTRGEGPGSGWLLIKRRDAFAHG